MDHNRDAGRHGCGHPAHFGHPGHGAPHGLPGQPHHGGFRRCFRTREERIARLDEYLKELRLEAQAVEERLAELRAAS